MSHSLTWSARTCGHVNVIGMLSVAHISLTCSNEPTLLNIHHVAILVFDLA